MSGFHQVSIGGYPGGGLTKDKKPALLPNEAFSKLENAYVFRERTKKRDGDVSMGRLSRSLSTVTLNAVGSGKQTIINDIFSDSAINLRTSQPNAQIVPGTMVITFGTAIYTDTLGDGIFTVTGTGGLNGTIQYNNGLIDLATSSSFTGQSIVVSFSYYPLLPTMGILNREVSAIGIDSTIFFDTMYAYQYINGFQELSSGTTWTGTNTNFFWGANFQGATADLRYFFVTNNNINDPIRYFNNSVWTDLKPLLTETIKLWQALILIPYYGRLLALNTWEGATESGSSASANFFSRCRFSQVGNPIDQTNGWRSDIFGRGGYIDAPTNESIVSAAFFRNTLIVFFEYSTWQLRYIGEYGIPFIWERISSDFGSVCPYSSVILDQGVLNIGNRGIIQAAANGISRIDEQIPNEAFGFQIQNQAPNFVHGIRDFEKELIYWNYLDKTNSSNNQTYPNTVLVFNYRNNTWAKFRDTITCFGPAQFQSGGTWDSLDIFWDSDYGWDTVDEQNYANYTTSGNQQGFINIYQNLSGQTNTSSTIMYANSLCITDVNLSDVPAQITSPSHNLKNFEIIYIQGMIWSGADPGLNNIIYRVVVIDQNTLALYTWNQLDQSYDAVSELSLSTYLGGGVITLLPKMNIVGKDFNPFQQAGKQFKLSYIDFQMDSNLFSPAIPAVTIQLFVNSYLSEQANLIASNKELINSSQNVGFITNASQSDPCQITSPNHSLITGTYIYIANILTMTQLNHGIYIITVVDSNNFTLRGIDSSGFTPYDPTKPTGIWNTNPTNGQTYIPGSEYAWYRFYSTQFGQYLRIGITYDDTLMNQLSTHQVPMELNAMNLWMREGGRICN